MYSPKIKDDQIRKLYRLSRKRKKPMTHLVREAIDDYLGSRSESPTCPNCGEMIVDNICEGCGQLDE